MRLPSLRLLAALALAGLFFLLLALRAPAHLLGYALDEDRVRLSGFSGTIWTGRASTAAIALDEGWVQLGQVQWSLSELYMLLLTPTADIVTSWGQQRLKANVQVTPAGRIRLRGVDATFSAALVKRFMPVNLRGRINITSKELVLEDGRPSAGAGRAVWQQAFWRGSRGAQPLGDYLLEFRIPGPGRAEARVTTLSGDVRVEGDLSLTGRRYSLDTRIRSRGTMDEELANALALMAVPVDDGFMLKFSSEI